MWKIVIYGVWWYCLKEKLIYVGTLKERLKLISTILYFEEFQNMKYKCSVHLHFYEYKKKISKRNECTNVHN